MPIRISMLMAVLLLYWLTAVPGFGQAQEEQTFIVMQQAEFVVSRSVSPPGDDAPWQAVRLPDDWNQSRPDFQGSVWYRMRFEAANPRVMRTLYVPRITGRNMRWFVNGSSMGSSGGTVDARAADSYRPFQRGIPPSLQKAGENIVHIQVLGEAQHRHGLTTVTLGVGPPVVARFILRQDLQVTSFIVFGATVFFAACVCLAIWLATRKESLLWWAAVTGFAWSLWALEFGWPVTFSLDKVQHLALYLFRYLYIPPLLVLCLEAAGRRHRPLELALWSAFGMGALAALVLPENRFPSVLTAASLVALVLVAALAAILAGSSRSATPWPQRLLAMTLLGLLVLGAHDWGRWMGLVDYENMLLAPYATPFLLVALGGAVVNRYLYAMKGLEQANEILASRVQEQVWQAQSAQRRVDEVLREQAVLRERQRIMSDMHDGIGADLISLLNVAQSAGPSSPDVARRITQLLVDLRVIVDSLEPVEGDLGVVLGNVRYRMRAAIEQSGIRLNWNVKPLPAMADLTPEKVLSIQRIVMEALSNALQHSDASKVSLSASHDAKADRIVILIEDDGKGFDASRVGPGRGLRSMRQRAQQTGVGVDIRSQPGGGTAVCLEIAMNSAGRTDQAGQVNS